MVDRSFAEGGHADLVVADVRFYLDGRSAREAFDRGHLPGAVFIDLARWLSAEAGPEDGRHPLPTPEVFAEGLGRAGIGDRTTVVAYDDAGGVIASRLVWMLRAIGHDAALLDGGLTAWDGPLEGRERVVAPATFTPVPWPADRLATIDDATDPANLVVDARDAARFAGGPDPVDPRTGHIPGARSLPCRDHLGPDGRLRSVAELRDRLAAVGITPATGPDVVSYCGSGVTACHNLLVMEHAGVGGGRLYPGSWSQYSHTDRPVATGDAP
ncbi:sulfurtransferase [Aquihabitans sp. G128]|nr:sulfurtransferase [Aquihabitans sp. G128]QXC62467.1 sulfurtransferase [Aquihabitans sp. G128]